MIGLRQALALGLALAAVLTARADFEIYFLRHGQTDWNRDHKLQGSVSHTKLTDEGRRMATETAAGMAAAGIRFDRVYTSPYNRAKETAELVAAKTGPKPVEDARLREMCFGKYEGATFVKGKQYPDDNLRWLFEDPARYVPQGEGAETFGQVQARLREFLEGELKPLDGKVTRVLCVAHALVLRSLVRELTSDGTSATVKKTKQPNCCVHVVRYANGKFALGETGKIFYKPKAETKEAVFTAATYNVRFDAKEDGPDLAWDKRLPRIAEVVRKGGFDLVGFQEVTKKMFPTVVSAFPEYKVVGVASGSCPVPIAYRPELFELIDWGRFSMSERPDDYGCVSWGASGARMCLWALLRVKANGRKMRVFNMHPDWKSCKARAKGMEMSLERIRAAMTFGEDVILLGDLNDMEGIRCPKAKYDPLYPMGTSVSMAKGVLRDTYDVSEQKHEGTFLTAHWYGPKPTERPDYVFVSPAFEVLTHRTHNDRPGGKFPSDHDPVSAKVRMKK